MRKIKLFAVSIVAMIAMTVGTATAQGFYFGPKAALNLSSATKLSNSTSRLRGAIGVMAGLQMTDFLAIQAEAMYSWQGTGFEDLFGNSGDLSLNYLKVPVMAKIFLIGGLNAEAGLSFNFLMGAREKYLGFDGSIKDLNSFDLSIPVGLNYLIMNKIEVGLRYDISLVNIKIPGSETAKNSNFTLSVAYRF